MVLGIDQAFINRIRENGTIERGWDNCLDIASFAGVGYLCGRAINWLTKWTTKPSLFTKAELIDLKSATICCTLFITIDRIAYALLNSYLDEEEFNKPAYTALRIGVNLTAAIGLFNAIAFPLKQASIEFKAASAIILTAIAVYSQILFYFRIFNERN